MKHTSKTITGLCLAAAIGCAGMSMGVMADDSIYKSIDSSNYASLLGVENPDKYFLGIASQFSVFLEEDFTAEGSDCEGRLAAGGNANLGELTPSYSVGAKLEEAASDVAHVVLGGDTLQNFHHNNMNFVVGTATNVSSSIQHYAELGQCSVYEGKLIDFDKEFALLRSRSQQLAAMSDNADLTVHPDYAGGWTVTGSDPVLNVVTLTAEEVEAFKDDYIEFSIYIPEGSYLVLNVEGEHVEMPGNTLRFYNEDGSARIVDETMIPVLYNLPDATSFHYMGSLFGSTLAPNADGSGEEGGHVAGATFAKSFKGGIEFGYTFFNLIYDGPQPESTTTTAVTTSIAISTTQTTLDQNTDIVTTSTQTTIVSGELETSTSGSTTTGDDASDTNTTTSSTNSTTTTTKPNTTTTGTTSSSPKTGDPIKGGMFAAAGAALLAMTLLRKHK